MGQKPSEGQISAALVGESPSLFETIRGGVLMVLRWFVVIPVAYLSYEVRGLAKAPWRLGTDHDGGQSASSTEAGIVVANHPNAFFDLLMCLAGAPRWAFFLHERARTRVPVFNSMVWLLRGLAVSRRVAREQETHVHSEDKQQLSQRQRKTHKTLVRLLSQKSWLIIFPQGRSREQAPWSADHVTAADESMAAPMPTAVAVPPLRPGFALAALDAASSMGWSRPVWIYPLGLYYEDARYVGTRCHAVWAKPLDVRDFQKQYELYRHQAALAVCEKVHELIRGAVLAGRHQMDSLARIGEIQTDRLQSAATTSACARFFGRGLVQLFLLMGLPFRLYGKLAARRPTEVAAYSFSLWFLCAVIAIVVGGWRYFAVFCLASVVATRTFVMIRRSFAVSARS